MRTTGRFFAGALLLAVRVAADVTVFVDIADVTDSISLPPPGIVVIDIASFVHDEDGWDHFSAGMLRGRTFGGVELRYLHWADPNNPNDPPRIQLTNPGSANRFVTFFGLGWRRDVDARYTNGCVAGCCATCPTGVNPVSMPSRIDAAFFRSPPGFCQCKNDCEYDWWCFRIALDIASIEPFLNSPLVLAEPGGEPPGFSPLFISQCDDAPTQGQGTWAASLNDPEGAGLDWGLYALLEAPAELPGDLDGDCDVDLQDLVVLLAHFGTPSGGGATYEQGDIFGDGGVDLTDLTALLSRFGENCP